MIVETKNNEGGGMAQSFVNSVKEKNPPAPPQKENNPIWEFTTMSLISLKDKSNANPSFNRCFDPHFNLNKSFREEAIRKTTGEDHLVCEIIGQQGLGKSRVAQCIARIINPKITAKQIGFTNEQLLGMSEVIPSGSCLIEDEQVVGVGEGSEREKLEKQNLIEVTRKHGLSLLFLSPTTRNLSSVHYVLEVIQRCKTKRYTRVAVKNNNSYLGYLTVFIPEDKHDQLYLDYLPMKNEFIEKVLKRNVGRINYEEKAQKLMDHKDIKYCKNINDYETLSMELNPTLTTTENKRIARKIKFLKMKNPVRPYVDLFSKEHLALMEEENKNRI